MHDSSDNKVYAAKNIKKGGLKLYPVGFLVKSLSDEKDKGKAIVQHSDSGFKFRSAASSGGARGRQVLFGAFLLGPAFHRRQQHGAWPTAIGGKSIIIPFLKNKVKLVAGEQLLFEKLPAKGRGPIPTSGAKRKA